MWCVLSYCSPTTTTIFCGASFYYLPTTTNVICGALFYCSLTTINEHYSLITTDVICGALSYCSLAITTTNVFSGTFNLFSFISFPCSNVMLIWYSSFKSIWSNAERSYLFIRDPTKVNGRFDATYKIRKTIYNK